MRGGCRVAPSSLFYYPGTASYSDAGSRVKNQKSLACRRFLKKSGQGNQFEVFCTFAPLKGKFLPAP